MPSSTSQDCLILNASLKQKEEILSGIIDHIYWNSREISRNSEKIKAGQVQEIRDQGFTKAKVLIITPLRSTAYAIISNLISLTTASLTGTSTDSVKKSLGLASGLEVRFKSRFMEEYHTPGHDTDLTPSKEDNGEGNGKGKPEDYDQLFGGNNDDCFKMGIKFSKKSIALYSNFYSCDLIIGSPLGLRMAASSKDGLNFDFLSGIETVLVDHSEVLLMQNWEHTLLIFNNLNLIPKVDHGADFSRIREWALDGYSKYLRQTIILSKYGTPELNNLLNTHCFNIQGKVKNFQRYEGSILKVVGQVPQVFYRYNPLSVQEDPDARFKFFLDKIMANVLKSALLQSHTLIFIPSYFDFTRIRSYFKEEMPSFAKLSEYSTNEDISRARGDFFHGKVGFLLMTERFHFYKRYQIRGIKNIIFYGLPMHDHFYSELINSIQDSQDATIMTIYSRYDKMSLERVVGSKSIERMIKGEKDSFLYS